MSSDALGKVYEDGQVILRQGDVADGLFVIQEGQAQVVLESASQEQVLRVMGEGELIGEMAIFEKQTRSATVRALGRARVLTIDKKNFLRRMHEDLSIAFRIMQSMSRRVRELSDEVAQLKGQYSETGQ